MKTKKPTSKGAVVISIPLSGHVVICHRRWTPGHVNSDGKPRTETVLGRRMSREPWTVNEDTSCNTWWCGVNEAQGREWSDSTVESWQPILFPNNQQEQVKASSEAGFQNIPFPPNLTIGQAAPVIAKIFKALTAEPEATPERIEEIILQANRPVPATNPTMIGFRLWLSRLIGRVACHVGLHQWRPSLFVVESSGTINRVVYPARRYTKHCCQRCHGVKVTSTTKLAVPVAEMACQGAGSVAPLRYKEGE